MRLRLIIERHGLPSTQLLWTVGGPGLSSSTSQTSSATIADLLKQVNQFIPLESDEWGLEDYLVNVSSFECLHFYPLTRLLKENDTVT